MNEVVIDGALPRTEAERVSKLLDYAQGLLDESHRKNTWDKFPVESYRKYYDIEAEYRHHYLKEDYEFWNSIEADVILLINDLLPEDEVCTLADDDPGTIIVCPRDELEF